MLVRRSIVACATQYNRAYNNLEKFRRGRQIGYSTVIFDIATITTFEDREHIRMLPDLGELPLYQRLLNMVQRGASRISMQRHKSTAGIPPGPTVNEH